MAEKGNPQSRHEFVGMMFAVAVGEIGIKFSEIYSAGNWQNYLPAYAHLLLALIAIAASWVGWSRSHSPEAEKDVSGIFNTGFVILLLDVGLVVCYFILVRLVGSDPEGSEKFQYAPHASVEAAQWIFFIFCIYLIWDFYAKPKFWEKPYSIRILVTFVCVILSGIIWRILVSDVKNAHILFNYLALLSLVLFFRAGKDSASAYFPSTPNPEEVHKIEHKDGINRKAKKSAVFWSVLLLLVLMGSLIYAIYL